MFSFAMWDEAMQSMFCARDRFGIKPFYYTVVDGVFYFASEAKALLPFLSEIDTDPGALAAYMIFQYTMDRKSIVYGQSVSVSVEFGGSGIIVNHIIIY